MFAIIAGFPENLIASFGGHPKNAPSARLLNSAFPGFVELGGYRGNQQEISS
jgi:hypothetical protein